MMAACSKWPFADEMWLHCSFAAMVYDANAQPTIDRLWDETMNEFQFAGAKGILEAMRR